MTVVVLLVKVMAIQRNGLRSADSNLLKDLVDVLPPTPTPKGDILQYSVYCSDFIESERPCNIFAIAEYKID